MEALGVNLANLLVQLFAFVVFIFIFWKFALGPITNMIDQRQARIQEGVDTAQRMERELAAAQTRNEEVLLEARREAQKILASARDSGEQMQARSREQAQAQFEEMIERARSEIEAERQQSWMQLRHEVADLAISAATKIVRSELDRTEQTRLIEETLAEADGDRRMQA